MCAHRNGRELELGRVMRNFVILPCGSRVNNPA